MHFEGRDEKRAPVEREGAARVFSRSHRLIYVLSELERAKQLHIVPCDALSLHLADLRANHQK